MIVLPALLKMIKDDFSAEHRFIDITYFLNGILRDDFLPFLR